MVLNILYDDRTGNGLEQKYSCLIRKIAEQTLKSEGVSINTEISVSFVDNAEIRNINKRFRRIDKETDVLSFPLIDFKRENNFNKYELYEIGDIIISYEKALRQSEEYAHTIEREIAFLTAHSMLHLLGYDHMNHDGEKIMFEKQKNILNSLGIVR